MKKEKLLKLMLVIIMGSILFLMSTNVFALSDDDFLDLTNTVNTNTNTNTAVNTNTNLNTSSNSNLNTTTTNTNMNTNTDTSNYNTNLPNTGVAENTMLGIALTILAIIAVYAYRKVKYYKNI